MNVEETKSDATPKTPESEKKECTMCGGDIPRSARRCDHCKSLQFVTECVVCKEFIPFNAQYCNQCKSYQDGRWYLGMSQTVLALLVTLIAVLTPLLKAVADFATWHSKTSIAFQSATTDEIMIIAMNTGRQSSLVRRCWLEPAGHSVIDRAELKIVSDDPKTVSLVPANGQIAIRLRVLTGLTATVPHSKLSENLADRSMRIVVGVEESKGRIETRSDTVAAEQVEDFIATQVPEISKQVPR